MRGVACLWCVSCLWVLRVGRPSARLCARPVRVGRRENCAPAPSHPAGPFRRVTSRPLALPSQATTGRARLPGVSLPPLPAFPARSLDPSIHRSIDLALAFRSLWDPALPSQEISRPGVRVCLVRALRLPEPVVARAVSPQQHGGLVRSARSSRRDALAAHRVKPMTRTRAAATNPRTIDPTKRSPFYTQCGRGGGRKDALSHLFGACPIFHPIFHHAGPPTWRQARNRVRAAPPPVASVRQLASSRRREPCRLVGLRVFAAILGPVRHG